MKKSILMFLFLGVVICGLLYFNFRKSQQDKSSQSTATNTLEQSSAKENSLDSKDYLVIKEWGVRMTLPDAIKEAEYEYHEYSGAMYKLLTVSFTHKDSANINGCKDTPLMSISRAKEGQPIAASGATVEELKEAGHGEDRLKYIEGYYFFSEGQNGPCYDSRDDDSARKFGELRVLFDDAYKTLESF